MANRGRYRLGRQVSYKDATYGNLPAMITAIYATNPVTFDVTVFTPGQASGTVRVQAVTEGINNGQIGLFGDGVSPASV